MCVSLGPAGAGLYGSMLPYQAGHLCQFAPVTLPEPTPTWMLIRGLPPFTLPPIRLPTKPTDSRATPGRSDVQLPVPAEALTVGAAPCRSYVAAGVRVSPRTAQRRP